MQQLILVSEDDNPIGYMEKMEAHQLGLLHRAFSVFIFDDNGNMLLQQRAISKYHSGGLWSNACCSHPYRGQDTLVAAQSRLKEEMGFTTAIQKILDFKYKARFDNGLTENEFDHVYIGTYSGEIKPDPNEVESYRYMEIMEIKKDILIYPERYTVWFKIAFPLIENYLAEQLRKKS